MKWLILLKANKKKVIALVAAIFGLAAALGSDILTPEQREKILALLTSIL